MPTTPATTLPAMSNGQTGADLAMSNGISQADYMKAEAASPGLNPDAIIGNIMSARARNAAVAPTKAAPLPPPVTVTSDPARAKFNQDSQALDALQNNRNAAAVQAQSSQNGRVTYADGSYQNAGAVGSQYMRFDANGAPLGYGAYEAPTQGGQEGKVRTPEEQQLLDLSTSYQNEYDSIKSKLDQAQATADQYNADLIQNIKDSYAQRKAQMERINAGLVGQTTQAGIRAGRNIYAPEMEAGMISSAELDGVQRLAALDAEEKNLILQAQMAKSDKDMERLSKSMDALEANNNRKRQAILDLHQIQKDTEDTLMARMQEKREQAKFEFDIEQELNKPALEAEAAAQKAIFDFYTEYPDAEIDPFSDSLAEVREKVTRSASYQQKQAQEADAMIQRYEYAVGQGYAGTLMDFIRSEETSSAPTYREVGGELYEVTPDGLKPATFTDGDQRQAAMEQAVIDAAESKVKLVEEILNHPGKGTAVGTGALSRLRVPFMVGNRNDFVAKVEQLISQETLDTLTNLKAKGGTLGALSDTELKMLQNAATALGGFPKLRDNDGNVVGYKISEARFNEEAEKLFKLADKALNTAAGIDGNDPDYQELRDMFPEKSRREVWEAVQSQRSDFNDDLSTSQNGSGKVLALGKITGIDGSSLWKHGLDIDLKIGDPVPTPEAGKVIFVGKNGGFGNQVKIKTESGNEVWLSHLDSPGVKVGDTVRRGQFIGRGGNTGSTLPSKGGDGSHLDLTIKKPDGSFIPPRQIARMLEEIEGMRATV